MGTSVSLDSLPTHGPQGISGQTLTESRNERHEKDLIELLGIKITKWILP